MAKIVPNLFLAGVPKAGTSSLARWMSEHPEIEGGTVKELRVLMDGDDPLANAEGYWRNGLAGFARYFPETNRKPGARYRLDASPEYYYQETARSVIPELPDARVVLVLRDPAERVLSMYNFARNVTTALPPAMDFCMFLENIRCGSPLIASWNVMLRDAITHGEYIRYIKEWAACIGRERLLIYLFDDMRADSRKFMIRVARDLGIDPTFYRSYNFVRENESYRVRSWSVHRFIRKNRKKFPSGTVKNFLKSVYGKLNTMPATEQLSERDKAVLASLRDDYAPLNAELAAFLGRHDQLW
jgi:hypothetical protein